MKRIIISITAVIIIALGIFGYLKLQPYLAFRALANGLPDSNATLQPFTLKNHNTTYRLNFYSDAQVLPYSKSTTLSRPGRTSATYVIILEPVNTGVKADCTTDSKIQGVFTVMLVGKPVWVCQTNAVAGSSSHPFYIMRFEDQKGAWQNVTLYNGAFQDLTPHQLELKKVLESVQVE